MNTALSTHLKYFIENISRTTNKQQTEYMRHFKTITQS